MPPVTLTDSFAFSKTFASQVPETGVAGDYDGAEWLQLVRDLAWRAQWATKGVAEATWNGEHVRFEALKRKSIPKPPKRAETLLKRALKEGDAVKLDVALEAGSPQLLGSALKLEGPDGQKHTGQPLALAAAFGHHAMVALLLDRGASPTDSAMNSALDAGHITIARMLYRRKDPELSRFMHAYARDAVAVRFAIECRAPLSLPMASPLLLAPTVEVAKLLLDAGADIQATHPHTFATTAIRLRSMELLDQAIDAGVDLTHGPPGDEPLLAAVAANWLEGLERLEQAGVTLIEDRLNHGPFTTLFTRWSSDDYGAVYAWLLERGTLNEASIARAPIEILPDAWSHLAHPTGVHALRDAVLNGDLARVAWLLGQGAAASDTELACALPWSTPEILDLLERHGLVIDPDHRCASHNKTVGWLFTCQGANPAMTAAYRTRFP